jgi:hypothetical protein
MTKRDVRTGDHVTLVNFPHPKRCAGVQDYMADELNENG